MESSPGQAEELGVGPARPRRRSPWTMSSPVNTPSAPPRSPARRSRLASWILRAGEVVGGVGASPQKMASISLVDQVPPTWAGERSSWLRQSCGSPFAVDGLTASLDEQASPVWQRTRAASERDGPSCVVGLGGVASAAAPPADRAAADQAAIRRPSQPAQPNPNAFSATTWRS